MNVTAFTYPGFRSIERCTAASYGTELTEHRFTEARLRAALAREEALQKDELIHHREFRNLEPDHRLLNGLQMIGSLLGGYGHGGVGVG